MNVLRTFPFIGAVLVISTLGRADADDIQVASAAHSLKFAGFDCVELQGTRGLLDVSDNTFTVEMFMRWDLDHVGRIYLAGDHSWPHSGNKVAIEQECGWVLLFNAVENVVERKLEFNLYTRETRSGGIGRSPVYLTAISKPMEIKPSLDWHHVCFTKTPSTANLFFDGRMVGKETFSSKVKFNGSPTNLFVGCTGGEELSKLNRSFKEVSLRSRSQMEVKGFRISSKVLYPAIKPYSVPAKFAKEKETLLLLDFTGEDTTTIKDLSGKNHHGKISGPTWSKLEDAK